MDGSYPGVPAVGDGEEPLGAQHGGAGVCCPPKPAPSKHRAELLLEAGLRRWVPRKDTQQEQVRDIRERRQGTPSRRGPVHGGMWAQGPWAVGGRRAEGALAVKIRARV